MFASVKNKILPIYEEGKNICRRLRSIDMHFKAERFVKNDIFEISYKGKDVKFYLPFALFDQVQMAILDGHAFHEHALLEHVRKIISQDPSFLIVGRTLATIRFISRNSVAQNMFIRSSLNPYALPSSGKIWR